MIDTNNTNNKPNKMLLLFKKIHTLDFREHRGCNIGVAGYVVKLGACRFVNVGQRKCTEPTPLFTVKY